MAGVPAGRTIPWHEYRSSQFLERPVISRTHEICFVKPPCSEGAEVKATLSDIAACFRILLGREPSLEEIQVHAKAHVGNDLADVVKSYLESEEFRNRRIVQVVRPEPPRAQNTAR